MFVGSRRALVRHGQQGIRRLSTEPEEDIAKRLAKVVTVKFGNSNLPCVALDQIGLERLGNVNWWCGMETDKIFKNFPSIDSKSPGKNPRLNEALGEGENWLKPVAEIYPSGCVNFLPFILMPWGFLSQADIKDKVEPNHRSSLHTAILTRVYPHSPSIPKLLDEVGGVDQLCEGVKAAYLLLADMYSTVGDREKLQEFGYADADRIRNAFDEDSERWIKLNVVGQELMEAFLQVNETFQLLSAIPKVEINKDALDVELLGIWMEQGSIPKSGKFLGMDLDEIKYHLLHGFIGPEFAARILGKSPRRIVAAFCITSEESFEMTYYSSLLPEKLRTFKGPKRTCKHYWVLETDYNPKEGPQWRVRNINDAVYPQEGEKMTFDQLD